MNEPQYDLGQHIEAEHSGGVIVGRVIGREHGDNRYRMPREWLYVVKPSSGGGLVEVAESCVLAAN